MHSNMHAVSALKKEVSNTNQCFEHLQQCVVYITYIEVLYFKILKLRQGKQWSLARVSLGIYWVCIRRNQTLEKCVC